MDTGNGLSDILNSLMQNPEVMKTISSIANNTGNDSAPKDATAENASASPDEGFSIPPELLAKLPQMMSALSGLGTATPSEKEEGSSKSLSLHNDGQRKALLHALKPFLSEKRCSVIDSLLQFEGLAGVLGSFRSK